jgi:prepilin-type N-terminal cleavage/methylation domain-containing protein
MRRTPLSSAVSSGPCGFSLLEIAVVLVILSLIASALLTLGTRATEGSRQELTEQRMARIEQALGAFLFRNNRLPCPAIGYAPPNAAEYGVEDASASCTTTRIVSGGIGFHAGTVPVAALSLSDEYMLDGWNRRFTYIVEERAIDPTIIVTADPVGTTGPPAANDGRLTVFSEGNAGTTRSDRTMMLLISHGRNGYGAWPMQQPSGNTVRISTAPPDLAARTGEAENAHNPAVALSFDAEFTQEVLSASFDDMVRFYEREPLIQLAGGITDVDVCELTWRALQPTSAFVQPPEGVVGCINDADNFTVDPNCRARQCDLARTLGRLCFLDLSSAGC